MEHNGMHGAPHAAGPEELVAGVSRALVEDISASFDDERDIDMTCGYVDAESAVRIRFTRLERRDGATLVSLTATDLSDGDESVCSESIDALTMNELYDIWRACRG